MACFSSLLKLEKQAISSNLSFVIPFNQIHDRANFFYLITE
ncbi:MAG: hypothetical protein ACI85I_001654 [Arenicella sp.]